jgi:hypothetical protein
MLLPNEDNYLQNISINPKYKSPNFPTHNSQTKLWHKMEFPVKNLILKFIKKLTVCDKERNYIFLSLNDVNSCKHKLQY